MNYISFTFFSTLIDNIISALEKVILIIYRKSKLNSERL